MFKECESFKQDLEAWNIDPHGRYFIDTFLKCPTQPKWYIKNKL
jgi:hypothetical protein